MNVNTRRDFLKHAGLSGLALGTIPWLASSSLAASGELAWPHPIGLELYTVRHQMARAPLATLRMVAQAGYRLVETDPYPKPHPPLLAPAKFLDYLHQTGLGILSGLTGQPRPGNEAQWRRRIAAAQALKLKYLGTMETSVLNASGWKKLAKQYDMAGRLCQEHGLRFFYHNHITEFIPTGGTTGYEILQSETDPHRVYFEMDVFWMTYARQDPVAWFRRAPGRYPLLHVKDMKKHMPAAYNPHQFPRGFQPFTEVGRGRVNWQRVFAHIHQAGVKHVYVEQDRSDIPVKQAIRISYEYLRHLRLKA